MKSFLMIGQSNMAGRGVIGEVPEIKNDKCFMLRNGKWQPMAEPVNPDRAGSFCDGVTLATSFADEYAKYFGEKIGLIPCADGGTSIKEWQPDELLYDNAVYQSKLAQRTSEIIGILWHQGENDSYEKADADQYHDRFMNMISSLFKDLNLPDDTPVLIGEIGDFVEFHEGGSCKYFKSINKTLENLSRELKNSAFISSKGLTCKPDLVHFDAKSQREFGKRYFKEYLKLVGK